MNVVRRLVRWFATLWAVLRGIEGGVIRPLPPPVVDPDLAMTALIAEAEARGAADAATMMYDHWSFGVEGDEESDDRDPEYVRSLRRRCAAALAQLHDRNALTTARLSHVYTWVDESAQFMAGARHRMGVVAAWEADRERADLANVARRDAVSGDVGDEGSPDPTVTVHEGVAAHGSPVWEGETTPLHWFWRLLLIGCLIAVEYPVHRYVFTYYLAGSAAADLINPVTMSSSVMVVLAPYLAGLLFRGRRGTGGERRLALIVTVMALPWLYAIGMLGFLRGRILEVEAGAAAAGSARLHVTALTVVIMFVALLLIAGLMAFTLGLARRHPFQEAYVRQRRRHERYQAMAQRMADSLNPGYRGRGDTAADNRLSAAEQVLRECYRAAEEAYFAAITRAIGDPTFTEAVSRRRGLRPAPAVAALSAP